VKAAIELGILDGGQNFLESRTRLVSHGDEIVSGYKRRRSNGTERELRKFLPGKVVQAQTAVAGFAVQTMKFQMLFEVGQANKLLEG